MRVLRNTTIRLGPGDVAPREKKMPAARIASQAKGSMDSRGGRASSTLLKRGLHPSAKMEVTCEEAEG
tara:strand:- start:814 stop:1017 length:204 start_codon:yes stop_codon:yes gene_type:complete